jgi:hypothetical protein
MEAYCSRREVSVWLDKELIRYILCRTRPVPARPNHHLGTVLSILAAHHHAMESKSSGVLDYHASLRVSASCAKHSAGLCDIRCTKCQM